MGLLFCHLSEFSSRLIDINYNLFFVMKEVIDTHKTPILSDLVLPLPNDRRYIHVVFLFAFSSY